MHPVIREYEKCLMREAYAFEEWKRRLYTRVAEGKLPKSVEPLIETFNILDMFDDMKAHSVRQATAGRRGEFEEEFRNVPYASMKGVLTWSNRLAFQHNEALCNDIDELHSKFPLERSQEIRFFL